MSGRIAATISILILLPILVGPIIVGFVLEDRITKELERSGAPFILEYERGLFASTARTTIPLSNDMGLASDEGVVFEHVLVHGPIPLAAPAIGASPFDLVAFMVQTRFDADESVFSNVARALGGEAVFTANTRVGLDRDAEVIVASPPFELAGGTFEWKGLSGQLTGSPSSGRAAGFVEMHGLEIFDGATTVSASPASVRFEFDTESTRLVTVMDQQGIEFTSEDGRIALGTFHLESDSPVSGDPFGPSEGLGTLSELSGGGGLGGAGFLVSDLEFSQKNVLDEATGLQTAEVRLGFAHSQTGSRPPDGPGGFTMVLDRFDREAAMAFRDALQALEDSGASPEEIQAMRPFTVFEQLPALLASSPVLEVKNLSFDSPEGRLEGAFHLSVDGSQPEMLQDPFALMGQLEMRASLDAPESLLRRLLAPWANAAAADAPAPTTPTEGGREEAAPAPLLHPVDAWLASGILVRDGDRLRMDARFENGFPMLNGQPADPTLMMKLMPGM